MRHWPLDGSPRRVNFPTPNRKMTMLISIQSKLNESQCPATHGIEFFGKKTSTQLRRWSLDGSTRRVGFPAPDLFRRMKALPVNLKITPPHPLPFGLNQNEQSASCFVCHFDVEHVVDIRVDRWRRLPCVSWLQRLSSFHCCCCCCFCAGRSCYQCTETVPVPLSGT